MPFYDYECLNPNCAHVQEESHLMKETPVIRCEKCKTKMVKCFSKPQINMGEHPGSGLHEVS